MLAGNRLQQLPASMANCERLELIRLAANHFTELPDTLLSLPALSWLAYAGNPFCDRLEAASLRQHPLSCRFVEAVVMVPTQ